jgi:glycine/D-amino acid oxidase-like deaminating enzyme
LPARATIIVVGGGIVGASTAMHLAEAREADVLLLEHAHIAAGTSWHAAGLLARVRGSQAMTELASYGVDRYARLKARWSPGVGPFSTSSLDARQRRDDDRRHTEV